jgi:hypothetical protein
VRTDVTMRFAYADPPYLGTSSFGAAHHYGSHHDQAADYDTPQAHAQLVARLCDDFPDGWALSLHSPSLHTVLPMCPADVRVMAWVKPFASFKPGVNPAYAWEPVIVRGGRKRGREQETMRDWVAAPITLKKGLAGAKPEKFCWWLFDVLGMTPDDELVDLFPGSGAVVTAWQAWRANRPLPLHDFVDLNTQAPAFVTPFEEEIS